LWPNPLKASLNRLELDAFLARELERARVRQSSA
jgi:hypothetical protein